MPTGRVDAQWVAAARDAALRGLIDEQIGDQAARRTGSLGAAHWLATWGERLFAAVLVIVLVKLGLLWGSGQSVRLVAHGARHKQSDTGRLDIHSAGIAILP